MKFKFDEHHVIVVIMIWGACHYQFLLKWFGIMHSLGLTPWFLIWFQHFPADSCLPNKDLHITLWVCTKIYRNNGPYSLFVCASFISCSIHARFASVLSIESYWVNNKVIDVLYILMYYYTGILFVVLREGWVLYTSLFAGNLPWCARTIRD